MFKRAIILAGGEGTRLHPYTITMPKPLVPIGDYPILEIVIKQLTMYGFDHITIAIGHQAAIIQAYFGDGSKWGVKIDYSIEKEPLGTMGPLKLISDLPENFLVMNGDILTDLNFDDLFNNHARSRNIFTIASYVRKDASPYGVLAINENDYLIDFKEKPSINSEVSMGVYIANKRIVDYIPNNQPYGFDELVKDIMSANLPIGVNRHTGYWLDIGIPKDYQQAVDDFDEMKDTLLTIKRKTDVQ